jgi:hypothetical protein
MLSYFRWDIGTLVLRLLLTDLAYFFLIKPWYYRWGASAYEVSGVWVESWQFSLIPVEVGSTRLIHRNHSQGQGGIWDALDFTYFIMERAMLLDIK